MECWPLKWRRRGSLDASGQGRLGRCPRSEVCSGHNDRMAQHRARRRRVPMVVTIVVIIMAAAVAAVLLGRHSPSAKSAGPHHSPGLANPPRSTTTASTAPPTTTTSTLPPAAAGFLPGHVTAVGDSVMLDYQRPLQADIPGVDVEASVSRQWGAGEALLSQLKADGRLGAEVIVGLSTNGPISATDFDDMMAILQGASRIVFVNVHVDRSWQDPNNAVLAQGAARYP